VEGLTKIQEARSRLREAAQAENLRKLLLAMSKDIRVLLVKLADRLHNMRTLEHVAPDKRQRIAEETMDIYAPLAGRMGMQDDARRAGGPRLSRPQSGSLQDHHRAAARLRQERGDAIAEIEKALRDKLAENSIEAEVYGREKRPYSIWRKMERKRVSLRQLSDIFGFRVIVEHSTSATARWASHTTWRAVPGRFKDYISTPKQNDYRSIHTTVIGPRHSASNCRSAPGEMHEVAEYGIAAHGFYKDAPSVAAAEKGVRRRGARSPGLCLAAPLIDIAVGRRQPRGVPRAHQARAVPRPGVLLHAQGRLIACRAARRRSTSPMRSTPTSATPASAAKHQRPPRMPLMSELKNGDEVEIIRSRRRCRRPPGKLAVTGKARRHPPGDPHGDPQPVCRRSAGPSSSACAGGRRERRQHPHAVHAAHCPGFHRNADRP
jgi:GTP diphosphokinase / guanosine-3',5'-bis(diphosphate) 3'-diphosphatase